MPDFPNINKEDQDEICKWVQRNDEVEVLYRVNELLKSQAEQIRREERDKMIKFIDYIYEA